jgi:peptidoglycan L-alanyl-D-glutamate endopeptidase CwlK
MSRDIADLVPAMQPLVRQLVTNLGTHGFTFVPYVTLRTPHEQAELWRQSRTTQQVLAAVTQLKNDGAPWLASVMASSSPVTGREVTRALPGDGWHQFGEACDLYWEVDGHSNWDGEKGAGYLALAEEAARLGLTSGRGWTKPDYDHVQLRPQGGPHDLYSWPEIDAIMKAKFSNSGGTTS